MPQKIEKPNFTQIPNVLLESIREITPAELKVFIVICRQTFGYHRKRDPISITELSAWTGLSRQGVSNSIEGLIQKKWVTKRADGKSFSYEIDFQPTNSVDQSENANHATQLAPPCNSVDQLPTNSVGALYKERNERKDKERTGEVELFPLSNSQEKEEKYNPTMVMEAWNALDGPAKVICMTPDRVRIAKLRLKDEFWRDNWEEAMAQIPDSNFLMGTSDAGKWKADFDWFLQPGSVAKILEGKYENRNEPDPEPAPIRRPEPPPVKKPRRTEAELLKIEQMFKGIHAAVETPNPEPARP